MKKNITLSTIITISIIIITIIIIFILHRSTIKNGIKENVVNIKSTPVRSSHEKVDATAGATLLWNNQKEFKNIKISKKEKFAIIYPFENSVFPADFSSASFIWKSTSEQKENNWHISFSFSNFKFQKTIKGTHFKPDKKLWEKLKKKSKNKKILFKVKNKGIEKEVSFSFSKDSVVAPIFYRAIPLPFSYANKYRDRLKWYLGNITENKKRLMLKNMPVCANCHSFSKDGAYMAMDVDYGNDKGNYAFTKIENESKLGLNNIISWTDYKKDDGVLTFGLLAKISPDGKQAISTVKDKSIFVPVDKSFWYSQLFFPVKGLLVSYDREKKKFTALKGASDPKFVQSSPEWAPDMSKILFSRTIYHKDTSLEAQKNVVLDMKFANDYINKKKDFKFDLYSVPWNNGKGGIPKPIEGASNNNLSNYFARYTPDGKWIVFCKAENFMLLQPDSKLYIMPAQGGKPRLMNCNTNEMNSWHSFSPNSKWMVFSTKYFGAYTQLFMTHIDENGNDTPPIWLEQLTVDLKAANIPEFVNINYNDWNGIKDEFTKTKNYAITVAQYNLETKDLGSIIKEADDKIKNNPSDYHGYYLKALMLNQQGNDSLAVIYAQKSIEMINKIPNHGYKEYGDLGLLYAIKSNTAKAISMNKKALELNPKYLFAWKTLGDIYFHNKDYENTNEVYTKIIYLTNSTEYRLKRAQLKMEAKSLYKEAIEDLKIILKSDNCQEIALQLMIICYQKLNNNDMVDELSLKLIGCDPDVGYFFRGNNYFKNGKYQKAVDDFTEGLKYNRNDEKALFFRGNAFYALKKYDLALSDFQNLKQLFIKNKTSKLPIKQNQLDAMIERCKNLANYKN